MPITNIWKTAVRTSVWFLIKWLLYKSATLNYIQLSIMVVHLLQNQVEKKIFFFEKIYVFYKIYIICRKNVFIWKKSFILIFFLLKKTFFCREKYKWKCKNIYLIWEIYFYAENVCVTNKLWIFLKYIFVLQKKFFSDHKKYIC